MKTKKTEPQIGSEVILNIRIIRTPSGGHRVWIERSPDPRSRSAVINVQESENPQDGPGVSDPIN